MVMVTKVAGRRGARPRSDIRPGAGQLCSLLLILGGLAAGPAWGQAAPTAITDYPVEGLFATPEGIDPERQVKAIETIDALALKLNLKVPETPTLSQFGQITVPEGTAAQFVFKDFKLPGDSVLVIYNEEAAIAQILREEDLLASEGKSAFFDVHDGVSLGIAVLAGADSDGARVTPDAVRVTSPAPEVMLAPLPIPMFPDVIPTPPTIQRLELPPARVNGQLSGAGPESQCGLADDRVPSSHPWVGRIMPKGCTGWLISNDVALTAGHCDGGLMSILEFDVPPSLPDGRTQSAAIEDQYMIIPSSTRSQYLSNTGGWDWAVFRVAKNSNTGRLPGEDRGGFFSIGAVVSSEVMVTGYGVDANPRGVNGTRNAQSQTQQSHTGNVVAAMAPALAYRADTELGSSGSPISPTKDANFAIGIHNGGECNGDSGQNYGTDFTNPGLKAAIEELLQEGGNGSP